ncbi:hypothetical protein N0V85_007259 [Neurospora sp. IMI 360204]|nr:hypothetical protein N0V85_007259 [Neurospora sp. IMI 360204]
MSNNKSVVDTSENTVRHNMDPYKHLDKWAKSIDNKSQHKSNSSAHTDDMEDLIDLGNGEYTTLTNGDTTITYTKEDGWPRAYVTSPSAQVVTIPASFGRRPKTGNKSQHKPNNSSANADKTLIDFGKGEYIIRTICDTTITSAQVVTSTSAQLLTSISAQAVTSTSFAQVVTSTSTSAQVITSTFAQIITIPASFGRHPKTKTGNKSNKTGKGQKKNGTSFPLYSPGTSSALLSQGPKDKSEEANRGTDFLLTDETTTNMKPVDTHHATMNRKPTSTPCDSLVLLKRPTNQRQLYHFTTLSSEGHTFLDERAIYYRGNFALIPPPRPARQWSECPAAPPAASGPFGANGNMNEKEEEDILDGYRGCGPEHEYDLHPGDDENFTDVWYDDGE